MYAINSRHDSKNKLKVIYNSQSKNCKFEEYKMCLDGEKYQKDCDNYLIRSPNHDMYCQKVFKNSLSSFDDERCYESNLLSKPWE